MPKRTKLVNNNGRSVKKDGFILFVPRVRLSFLPKDQAVEFDFVRSSFE